MLMTQAAVNNAIVLYRLSADRDEVKKVQELYFTTPMLNEILTNPTIQLDKKYEIIDKVFALDKTPEVIVNYVKMMCRLGECNELGDIFDAYYRYWDEQNHVIRAELINAKADEDNKAEAEKFLRSRYPDDTIKLTESVDESLLGGYVIRAHHKEYDRSFEGRFRQLERKLT